MEGNLERFSGFADLYDEHRPTAPAALGPVLAAYAGVDAPDVVDIGSGTGLSTRWAATWARSVVGIEPNDDMRGQAEARGTAGVTYRRGHSASTGLDDGCGDVVLAVQAMHWLEPTSTLAEVGRLLRPGGVFAVVDADWPPIAGSAAAEHAWKVLHRRIRVLEARASRGEEGGELRRPIEDEDPTFADEDLVDPHRERAMPGGVRSWSKREHLSRMSRSGHFAFTRELLFDQPIEGGADRFVALMRSQGSYQGLRRSGLSDADIGADVFERAARAALTAGCSIELSFSWRARIGVTTRA